MRIRYVTASAALMFAAFLVCTPECKADLPPATLETRAVPIKTVRDDPDLKGKRGGTIELVRLRPGTIVLKGTDGKDREHQIKPIWMARYETRWDEYNVFWQGLDMSEQQWREWWQQPGPGEGSIEKRMWRLQRGMGARPERPALRPYGEEEKPDGSRDLYGIGGYPANCIHFQAARKYCRWLAQHTGKRFRLPTEAEWEYGCRAGGPPLRPDAQALDSIAWFAGNSGGRPHAVGRKRPNAWGLYDMLGNVGEYVVRDLEDDRGSLAGGSCIDGPNEVHSGAREPYSPSWQSGDPQDPKSTNWLLYTSHRLGFRVVMED